MKLPYIIAVDDDAQVLNALVRDLRAEFRKGYRIIQTTNPDEVLKSLETFKAADEEVAMIVSDQRMPEMQGVDLLSKARAFYPDARRVLLTAYSDNEAAIRGINDAALHQYLTKPWDPPSEKMYPILNELLEDWKAVRKPTESGIKVIGYQFSPKSHALKSFLAGNLVPYLWLDLQDNPRAQELCKFNNLQNQDFPAVIFEDGSLLKNPEPAAVGQKVGLQTEIKTDMYDVVIVGAGPAGLAAAVYGASEGLRTLLIDKQAPGGQAGTSSRIENYLGFAAGISGSELTRRAIDQAKRLGSEFLVPQNVTDITVHNKYKTLTLADGRTINALSVVIATGVEYRVLELPSAQKFTGAGVYYGAANTEAEACRNKNVFVVGGGNSAGQAAMYLSNFAERVYISIRREDLTSTMSAYLIHQINGTENIEVVSCSEVQDVLGDNHIEKVMLRDMNTNEVHEHSAAAVFVFIGARPYTDWIKLDTIKDSRGFIETGLDLRKYEDFKKVWKKEREPFLLETCNPGIFAAGDVRSGAMNRVASAVGEGAMAIKFVHEYLAEI
ncbi:MAG: FAD-dependent oxidoreductase [Bacteroidota bacterium]